MRNMLRCRRGSVAFATVVALVPLIGVVALGAEAASWYVTKQHAQNAADAAAYSGGLWLACSLSSSTCVETQTLDYRGKEFAAQNAFCNGSDTAYPNSKCATSLPAGTSQTVTIAQLDTWNGVNGNFVQAKASQSQPPYLARVLGFSANVDLGATGTAQVIGLPLPPCVLALTGSLGFQGSANIDASKCGMATNDRAKDALSFTGQGTNFTSGSQLSAAGGCSGSGASKYCNQVGTFTFMTPIANPFSALDSDLAKMCGTNPTLPAKCGLAPCGSNLTAYTAANPCTNDGFTRNNKTPLNLPAGVYFISGTLSLRGGSTVTGTGVTFILLPGAALDMRGGSTLTLTGPTSIPSALPTAFQRDAALFQYMSIYYASATPVTFGGNSGINLTGNIYAPKAAVTFQGDPTMAVGGGRCGELIAASVAFNGNASFDSSGCPSIEKPPKIQYVRLVP
jgi:hypothetical protein